MATVVIGGHSRNIGKTSLMAGIIEGLQSLEWTAIKITQYGHNICAVNGKTCHCSSEDHRFAVLEEKDRSGRSDSSRFLKAGAKQSFWVRTKQGMLHEVMPWIQNVLSSRTFVILESNSLLGFVHPDLYLQVLNLNIDDFKNSAREYFDLANAYVITSGAGVIPRWSDKSLQPPYRKPVFAVTPPSYVSQEILQFVKDRILCQANPQI